MILKQKPIAGIAAVLALYLVSFSGVLAKDKKDDEVSMEDQFTAMLPLGLPCSNVRIPSYKNAKLSTLLIAGEMTRVDDQNVRMKDLEIQVFSTSTRELQAIIEMSEATFNVPLSILSSEYPTKITRKDLVINGECMIYDVNTQKAKMLGFTRMNIYKVKNEEPAAASQNPEQKPAEPSEAPIYDPVTGLEIKPLPPGQDGGPSAIPTATPSNPPVQE